MAAGTQEASGDFVMISGRRTAGLQKRSQFIMALNAVWKILQTLADRRSSRPSGTHQRSCTTRCTRGGSVGGSNAQAKVYAVGHAGTNPDSNVMTGTFLLNNRYASVLFDTGADRSFVSTAFSSQIDITPTTLDHYYDVELDD
ncbi:putative reverse transcriptase domain-containing protein [Tanacetum coccineum]